MNRRDFLKAAGAGAASLVVPSCVSASSGPHKRPNVIFILIDDMGWPDVACYDSKFHETPNIDRLADQGMKFTDAYAACPVCSPTRASIMAGQYPARVGITDFIPGHWRPYEKLVVPENRLQLPLESVTIGEVLKEQGYATCYIGKWHLGGKGYSPDKQGFEKVVLSVKNRNDKQVSGFTDKAIEFIEEKKQEPFFLYLSHHSVHIKLEAPQELVDKYKNKPKPASGVNNPVYAAMVEHLDTHTGRILKKLDDLDLAERTIVIFFSDNGGLRQAYGGYGGPRQIVSTNAPLRDEKGTVYEGGVREPLIVRWPGVVKSGTICSVPVTSVDFYPTFLNIVGAKGSPNQPLDGESILPLLKQTGTLERRAIYWHYPHYHHSRPAGAIREGDWKLIEFFEEGHLELYNLKRDIGEKNNLAGTMPKKAAALQRKLAKWRKSVGAKMPTPNPDYDPARAHEWARRPRR
ncbi:MAG: arylsulfatase [Planctomycetes bacterium B3_Pla]|nr:MAG: arylsulfatase [Planctomycetes bacterium B3_Pla]